jgi:4-diphosphocytidyl-2-C-methyl-D-erythritol kinase
MQEQHYRAPSKINVFLAVNGWDSRRALHRLTSVFLPLDLCDELTIARSDDVKNDEQNTPITAAVAKKWSYKISVDGDEAPLISNQILDKVFQLCAEKYSLAGHYDVRLLKKIPLKSGLGGGSSDAAALLRFLNSQQQTPLRDQDLLALALRCGSDVPFFLQPQPSIVRNFGEKMEPFNIFDSHTVREPSWLLFKLPCGISTAEAYRCLARRASEFYLSEVETEKRLKEGLQSFAEKEPGDWRFYNSFQKLFVEMFPGMTPLLRALKDRHYTCGMSGSGSAWFIPLAKGNDGRDVMRQIRNYLSPDVWMSKVSGWSSM